MTNSPEARTETGEIKDVQVSVEQTQEVKEPESGAPETYADFTVPEGQTLDKAMIEGAIPIFKELGLTQEAAQKLVDFHTSQAKSSTEAAIAAVTQVRSEWRDQVKADPVIGKDLNAALTEIGRAKDKLPADVRQAMSEALDLTGAGDHPAVVRAFYEFAKLVNEGSHVSGKGPSAHGQDSSGKVQKPSAAASLYPNLPH